MDTVASVGAANLTDTGKLTGHGSWADNTQEIHPDVARCVHFVAGHEVRACFPLDSVRVKSSYPSNAREVMYPGSHSDVGGGYAPGALGVSLSPDSMLATIPGVTMYHEALKAGVPLLTWERLAADFRRDLRPSDDVIRDFNAYLKAAKVEAGPVEDMGRKHMSLYFSYRFKRRATFHQSPPCVTAAPTDQRYLGLTQDCLIDKLGELVPVKLERNGEPVPANYPPGRPRSALGIAKYQAVMAPHFDPAKTASMPSTYGPQDYLRKHAKEVAERISIPAVTPDVEAFFDRYVHDSVAGFIGLGMNEYTLNGIGAVKFRTVFKGND